MSDQVAKVFQVGVVREPDGFLKVALSLDSGGPSMYMGAEVAKGFAQSVFVLAELVNRANSAAFTPDKVTQTEETKND